MQWGLTRALIDGIRGCGERNPWSKEEGIWPLSVVFDYERKNNGTFYLVMKDQRFCAVLIFSKSVGGKMATRMLPKKGVKALGHRGGQIRAGDMATSVATRGGFSGLISLRSALLLPFLNLLEAVRGVIRL